MLISAVKIENFKRIKQVELTLADVTVLIGGNNSGKSSLLQGIHLAITTLQAARSASISTTKPVSTLGFDQLIFKPASDPMKLSHRTDMSSKAGPEITFTYAADAVANPELFELSMRRGKNANISVTFDHSKPFYERASDRARPLSIFVPGLAGVALREERRTDAIVTTGIAQGDANLYLRNVLLRLIDDKAKLDKFHAIIGEVFPGLKIHSTFDERIHQHIEIQADVEDRTVPLELVGTGTLQAIQLVAYATMYDPGLLLLDEPDAHLHPSNQRVLAATLLKIAEQGNAKIILATHSRHIFDALTRSSLTDVVWLKNGTRQERKQSEDLSILLDLGALDSFELLGSGKVRVVVLTEDTRADRLRRLLEVNGFPKDQYMIQPFNGVSNIMMCAAVADFFLKQGHDTYVLVHRDSDCLLPDEIEWYRARETSKLPERCKLFLAPLTDVEHQFCQPAHIADALNMATEQANALITKLIEADGARLAAEFAQKRADLKAKILREKENVPSATDLLQQQVSFEQVKGKRLWGLLNQGITAQGHNPMRLLTEQTEALKIKELADFAVMAWPPSPTDRPPAGQAAAVTPGEAAGEAIVLEKLAPAADAIEVLEAAPAWEGAALDKPVELPAAVPPAAVPDGAEGS
jgi:energy-coupling factor transporter ATP-binding protein EcfA2